MKSFDIKILFLSFLDSYRYGGLYSYSTVDPIFKYLMVKGAFHITADKLTPELKKDFLENLKQVILHPLQLLLILPRNSVRISLRVVLRIPHQLLR